MWNMNNIIKQIIDSCHNDPPKTNIRPTIFYNEGWLTRLLVEMSLETKIKLGSIDFSKINYWYSEGLLSSPFLGKGKPLGEGYTHADMTLGDFSVGTQQDPMRSEISLCGDTGVFGVIEAKLGSKLSSGTKNASYYDQASRTLACIAYITRTSHHSLFFTVVAPDSKTQSIKKQVALPRMLANISDRFDAYVKNNPGKAALKKQVVSRAQKCTCSVISFETWISLLKGHPAYTSLVEFKDRCYKFNRIV